MTKRMLPEDVSLRMEKKMKRRERRIQGWKKTAVFLMVLGGTLGIFQVDQAYSEMCGVESKLPPQISRQEDGLLQLSFFGVQTKVDMEEMGQACQRFAKKAEQALFAFHSSLLHLLRLDETEKEGTPFHRQPLSEQPMQMQLI